MDGLKQAVYVKMNVTIFDIESIKVMDLREHDISSEKKFYTKQIIINRKNSEPVYIDLFSEDKEYLDVK